MLRPVETGGRPMAQASLGLVDRRCASLLQVHAVETEEVSGRSLHSKPTWSRVEWHPERLFSFANPVAFRVYVSLEQGRYSKCPRVSSPKTPWPEPLPRLAVTWASFPRYPADSSSKSQGSSMLASDTAKDTCTHCAAPSDNPTWHTRPVKRPHRGNPGPSRPGCPVWRFRMVGWGETSQVTPT